MGCLQVHDFITGTTIALPRRGHLAPENRQTADIVRPNEAAAALVSEHLARIGASTLERFPQHTDQTLPL